MFVALMISRVLHALRAEAPHLSKSDRSWPSLLQTMTWLQPGQLSEHELCNLLMPKHGKLAILLGI